MTREELEKLDWAVGSDGESFWVEDLAAGGASSEFKVARDLQAAAPALALAVIEARRVFGLQAEDGDRGERASLEQVIEQLDAALAQARVKTP